MLKTILIIIGLVFIFLGSFGVNLPRVDLFKFGVGLIGVTLLIL